MTGKRVLFLCTGNFYRSRFAEELFNHYCRQSALNHSADSRALAIERGSLWNIGPMSKWALKALRDRNVAILGGERRPMQACDADFENADLVIALKELEHRPMVETRYPQFASRVRYWHVHDLDGTTPDVAMAQIEQLVRELLKELQSA